MFCAIGDEFVDEDESRSLSGVAESIGCSHRELRSGTSCTFAFGFFAYAAVRGDFALVGLQAVFETELNRLMEALIGPESRCVVGPGCAKQGSACVACLCLGEPSCRYSNRFLDRSQLFGAESFLNGAR